MPEIVPNRAAPVYLLDGYGIIFRSYFAFIRSPLRNPQGRNSSAIFGFFRTLCALFRQYAPQFFAVTLDSIGPTFRHQRYERYKATRDRTPEDLIQQIPTIEAILTALGIPALRIEGYEADDLMASYAKRCVEWGVPCRIITGDKDLLQLTEGDVRVLRPDGGGFRELGPDDILEQWGVLPKQILDYLSLLGDVSDNVPGVSGIGAKTSVALLQRFGDLDGIYANLNEIGSKSQREKLEAGRDAAYLSRSLITLVTDVPIGEEVETVRLPTLDITAATPLFEREGMSSLIDEMARLVGDSAGERSADAAAETIASSGAHYEAILDIGALDRVIEQARRAGRFAFDTETDSIDSVSAHPIGFSLSCDPESGYYIPLRGPEGAILPEAAVRERLASLLTDPSIELIGQNIKYDYKVMHRWGILIQNRLFDTMVAAWLINTTDNSYGLDHLALRWLNYETIHYSDLFPKQSQGESPPTFDSIAIDKATAYAVEDADIALRLAILFRPKLEEMGLIELMSTIEMALIPVLAEMELQGIALNTEALSGYSVELEAELDRLKQEIYAICGRQFNIGSTKQLQQVLFKELDLPTQRKTKTGYSTDTAVLKELASQHPAPAKILRHRLLAKLKSTYVDALPKILNGETNRLHTHFNLTGTATGRISSTDPNLQNIPIKDEEGRRIRAAFVPREGMQFVSADYSQIELVVLAHLAGDPGLLDAFRTGKDIHRETGALIFGVEPDSVTAEQRRIAKSINFGVMYGMSAFRLARDLGISRTEAKAFMEAYFHTYPRIQTFIADTIARAEREEAAVTLLRRRRPLPDINNRNRHVKAASERIAINTPIQGSAADIMKLAMLRIDRRLRSDGLRSHLLLQVHDELIVEAPDDEVEPVKRLLEEEMTAAAELSLPLQVTIETGLTWGALH